LLGTSFLKIGSLFGNRDHSTIMHAFRKIEARMVPPIKSNSARSLNRSSDANLIAEQALIEQLEQRLTNQFASQMTFSS
jgi:hypothetical protein